MCCRINQRFLSCFRLRNAAVPKRGRIKAKAAAIGYDEVQPPAAVSVFVDSVCGRESAAVSRHVSDIEEVSADDSDCVESETVSAVFPVQNFRLRM